jgi:predicted alpha/beta-hydrolase family hydrolase
MLFVEGTRDPFCPLETLYAVLEDLDAQTEVAVIEDGDHSFKVRKSSGRSTSDAWAEVIAATDDWIRRTSP